LNNEDPKNRLPVQEQPRFDPFAEENDRQLQEAKARREEDIQRQKNKILEKEADIKRENKISEDLLKAELVGATPEHLKMVEEIKRLEAVNRLIDSSESYVEHGAKKTKENLDKITELRTKFLALPFHYPDISIKKIDFYEGINRPDIKLVKEGNRWTVKNFDRRITRVETDEKGLPSKIFFNITLPRHFRDQLIPCYIGIKIPTEEQMKPIPRKVIETPKPVEPKEPMFYECAKCGIQNYFELLNCRSCGTPKPPVKIEEKKHGLFK